jgi:2-oxoacid:acceptor oxidoreductase gamma subunit (pyruvate/2-ketoisovalerate family)
MRQVVVINYSLNIFRRKLRMADENMIEVTIYTRGVILTKEARDVARALADAAAKEDKYVQAWENYMDQPDRVGVPVRAYARISPEDIESKYVYENDQPDIVVLIEETLLKGVDVLHGMKKDGVLVVNSKRSPENLLKFIPDKGNLKKLAVVDASGIGKSIAITFAGYEGASDEDIAAGFAAPLAGAVAKATGVVSVDSLAKVVKDPEAMRRGFDKVVVQEI